ncbi:hypothetical protein AURDEDRAFT_128880 [Auricularia subglabra TFB-10046 SS5]|nr:hypothetical protein AURDEDRAFT_128880 [Auricularia subglabra TFB-10046 SS5]
MNAEGHVKGAVASLAWHEAYSHSHEHPEIMERMREHTERAVHALDEAKGEGFIESFKHKREANREAAAAKAEHEIAMAKYEEDVLPEQRQYEERNERKIAERKARDEVQGTVRKDEPDSRTGNFGEAGVSRKGTLSFAGAH